MREKGRNKGGRGYGRIERNKRGNDKSKEKKSR